jgi:anaerobic ribonucleoside-triphosphate reductase activating protein
VLTPEVLDQFIAANDHISCVAFMGGDGDPIEVDNLALYLHQRYPRLKVAWYSGRTIVSPYIDIRHFDYIKIGPYIAHLGPLNRRTTNQHFYRVVDGKLEDITSVFWH